MTVCQYNLEGSTLTILPIGRRRTLLLRGGSTALGSSLRLRTCLRIILLYNARAIEVYEQQHVVRALEDPGVLTVLAWFNLIGLTCSQFYLAF